MTDIFSWAQNVGPAPWIALLIIGYCLVVVEMYIPGFGLPGLSGLLCLIVSIFFLSGGVVTRGLLLMLIVAVLLGVALFFSMRSAARGRLSRSRMVLHETSTSPETMTSEYAGLVGHSGQSVTALRPSGVALIDGQRLNVMTDGEFIPAETKVNVVRAEGNNVFVRAAA